MSDKKLDTVTIQRKIFFRIARDTAEYARDVVPSEELLLKLQQKGADTFTFLERGWCFKVPNPPYGWIKAEDNIGLIQTPPYDEWLKIVGKKTRNMVRKAEKSGIRTEIAEPNEELAEGIWRIFNEMPIRQERGFPHYGTPLETVRKMVFSQTNCTYIAAYLQEEPVGFIQLVHGENIAIISQILSLQKHWDKAVNNALIAKTIKYCASRSIQWIMYGRIGNHPSLDKFKQNNGFVKFTLTRYYIPLTKKGRIATKLGLHREMKDALPKWIKNPLIPLYNWTSRTKMKIRLRLEHRAFA